MKSDSSASSSLSSNRLSMVNVSSSEDSNSSTYTNRRSLTPVKTPSPPKIPPKPSPHFFMAENILSKLKKRFGPQKTGLKPTTEAIMGPLELLRINVQSAFDKEIDKILRRIMESHFKPALKNIKENLGDHYISEDVLQKMSCALLENSKAQYNSRTRMNVTQAQPATTKEVPARTYRRSETRPTRATAAAKRAAANSNGGPSAKKQTAAAAAAAAVAAAAAAASAASAAAAAARPKPKPKPKPKPVVVEAPKQTTITVTPQRRNIFWNTANISSETKFLLDVQANQAFGFGTDGKERLASKHPELIRYLPDSQDRDWLVRQKIIPAQNRNSRFLFLIFDEVMKLGKSETYRNRENLNLGLLQAFRISAFIIQKMKIFFIDLNIKSRGLITNSHSSIANSSHLRNALLQGSQSTTGTTTRSSSSRASASATTVSTSTDSKHHQTIYNQARKSSLSSSHATLTALLTNRNSRNNRNNSHNNSGVDSTNYMG